MQIVCVCRKTVAIVTLIIIYKNIKHMAAGVCVIIDPVFVTMLLFLYVV